MRANTTTSFLSLSVLILLGRQHVSAKPLSFVPRQSESNGTYVTGPVMQQNFPDPSIIYADNQWWAFATMDGSINIQVAQSSDFENWTYLDGVDALPDPPSWVDMATVNTWAPDVVELDDGTFVMYFSATTMNDTTKHCVGAALSDTVEGPYTPINSTLACPLDQGGAIDAAGFKDWETRGTGWGPNGQLSNATGDDNSYLNPEWSNGGYGGQRYIVYKVDGNTMGNGGVCGNTVEPIAATPIMLLAVAADGVTPQGSPIQLLDNAGVSDDGIVEAPSLVKTWDGEYVLFFSSGCYSTENYTVSFATSSGGVTGPYDRAAAPLLQTGDDNGALVSPGGMDLHWDANHMVFHETETASPLAREMWAAQVLVGNGTVSV
ncbi:glycoside hydrolase family 43 protein [Diplodia corticola]|uniref:Glycoside hydrolase family 43 protein n=1 Tax=Diplodia corticola TaxID=236234 RepID=A0A1J9RT01_9PEZI|nr:glycoside hydrolase family 43 protein [Diplodia corticola]OJD30661.1 glycoside hydrolase family 43 protein [Diplodia corticola]